MGGKFLARWCAAHLSHVCSSLSREREEREAESDFRMRECFMSPFCLHETLANLRNVDARREVICGSLLECCERGYT